MGYLFYDYIGKSKIIVEMKPKWKASNNSVYIKEYFDDNNVGDMAKAVVGSLIAVVILRALHIWPLFITDAICFKLFLLA